MNYRATFSRGGKDYAYANDVYTAARKILLRPVNRNKSITEIYINEGDYEKPRWKRVMFSENKIFRRKKWN